MKLLDKYQSWTQQPNGVEFVCKLSGSDDKLLNFNIYILEEDLIRVVCLRNGEFMGSSRTWMVMPGMTAEQCTSDGRCRLDLSCFSCPPFTLSEQSDHIEIQTTQIKICVFNEPLRLDWFHQTTPGHWERIAADRPTGAYYFGRDEKFDYSQSHYMLKQESEHVFGLGERAGPLNRSGKRYEMRAVDAMGYDAEKTDPLYKHYPLYLCTSLGRSSPGRTSPGRTSYYGLLYDTHSHCFFDNGREIDNYHPPFKYYHAHDGDLDYYLAVAGSLRAITQKMSLLTGKHVLPPRYSLGYCGSAMNYTEASDAGEQLAGFIENTTKHGIPCSCFKLSSGYCTQEHVHPPRRHVFQWNTSKIADPAALIARFRGQGIHVAANVKPCVLTTHPDYQALKQAQLFVKSADDVAAPEVCKFWDYDGSYLDFSNPATVEWWKEQSSATLLARGVECLWNDNNEFEIWDGDAACEAGRVAVMRPLLTLLMLMSSHESQREYRPGDRVWMISRGGCPGMQRYVQTWSGDNTTSWRTLRWNQKMGLGLSLSGCYNTGHDIGGFVGAKPDPELFVRWVQCCLFCPRFTIHSWHAGGTTNNEPWMHPSVTHVIRGAVELRYALAPYLYTCLWRAHARADPILAPLCLAFERDEACWRENDEFMVGEALLVAPVLDHGHTERAVYLPRNGGRGWWHVTSRTWYAGGREVTVPAPLHELPMFVMGGCVLPYGDPTAHALETGGKYRKLEVWPVPKNGHDHINNEMAGGRESLNSAGAKCGFALEIGEAGAHPRGGYDSVVYEDDGLTRQFEDDVYKIIRVNVDCSGNEILCNVTFEGLYEPAFDELLVVLGPGEVEERELVTTFA